MYLVSKEQVDPGEFEINTNDACLSGLIKKMVDQHGAVDKDKIHKYKLQEVDKKTLQLVVQYLKWYSNSNYDDENHETDIKNDNKMDDNKMDDKKNGPHDNNSNFASNNWHKNSINELDELSMKSLKAAAKYMDIASLYDLVDERLRSIVVLLPWDENKGFNVPRKQCKISNLLTRIIDDINIRVNDKSDIGSYTFTMTQIDCKTLELVVTYLQLCNGTIPTIERINDDYDNCNKIKNIKSNAKYFDGLINASHSNSNSPQQGSNDMDSILINKLLAFIVNIKDLDVLGKLEIASDYLQIPSLANLVYLQACHAQANAIKYILRNDFLHPVFRNLYSPRNTIALQPNDNEDYFYVITYNAALLSSKLAQVAKNDSKNRIKHKVDVASDIVNLVVCYLNHHGYWYNYYGTYNIKCHGHCSWDKWFMTTVDTQTVALLAHAARKLGIPKLQQLCFDPLSGDSGRTDPDVNKLIDHAVRNCRQSTHWYTNGSANHAVVITPRSDAYLLIKVSCNSGSILTQSKPKIELQIVDETNDGGTGKHTQGKLDVQLLGQLVRQSKGIANYLKIKLSNVIRMQLETKLCNHSLSKLHQIKREMNVETKQLLWIELHPTDSVFEMEKRVFDNILVPLLQFDLVYYISLSVEFNVLKRYFLNELKQRRLERLNDIFIESKNLVAINFKNSLNNILDSKSINGWLFRTLLNNTSIVSLFIDGKNILDFDTTTLTKIGDLKVNKQELGTLKRFQTWFQRSIDRNQMYRNFQASMEEKIPTLFPSSLEVVQDENENQCIKKLCEELRKKLFPALSNQIFDSKRDQCFCIRKCCKYNSNHAYALPIGWCKLGIKRISDGILDLDKDMNVSYHEVKKSCISDYILRHNSLSVSPRINAQPFYTEPDDANQVYRIHFAFQSQVTFFEEDDGIGKVIMTGILMKVEKLRIDTPMLKKVVCFTTSTDKSQTKLDDLDKKEEKRDDIDDDTKDRIERFDNSTNMKLTLEHDIINQLIDGNGYTLTPISVANDKLSSFIVPIVLDIDFNEFTHINDDYDHSDREKSGQEIVNLDTFLQHIPTVLGCDIDITMNCLCVSKGSSIIWIKFNDIEQEKLQEIIDQFLKNENSIQKVSKFHKKFKLNVQKTMDIAIKTSKNPVKQSRSIAPSFTGWMNKHIDQLYPLISDSMKSCHYDFKIVDIMVVDVPQRMKSFQQHCNFQESKLLFRASKEKHFASVINDGLIDFKRNKNTLGQWYGQGYYFTSFPAYAAEYYKIKHNIAILEDMDQITLIGCLVNTGNVRQVYEKRINEKIPPNYDTHYVRVYGNGSSKFNPATIGKKDKVEAASFCICGSNLKLVAKSKDCYQSKTCECNACDKIVNKNDKVYHCGRKYLKLEDHEKGYDLCVECFNERESYYCGKTTKFLSIKDQIYDEYVVDDKSRILPRYLIKLEKVNKIFVWRNTTFDKYPNAKIHEKIAQKNVVYVCKDSISALKTIEMKRKQCEIFVISNAVDGKHFVGNLVIKQLKIPAQNILVFTLSEKWAKTWADPLRVAVTQSPHKVEQFVQQNGF